MANRTYKTELNRCDPNNIADILRAMQLGNIFEIQEWDSGTITASATVTPPGGCLHVQSVRIVASGTAASVGSYLPSDSAAVMIVPPGGASAAVGVCRVSADGTTITLPNTVTQVVVRYIKKPAVSMSAAFNNG